MERRRGKEEDREAEEGERRKKGGEAVRRETDRQTDRQTDREKKISSCTSIRGGKVHFLFSSVQCCFTYGEGRGAQDGHLDFYTAPELWSYPSKQAKIQEREQK